MMIQDQHHERLDAATWMVEHDSPDEAFYLRVIREWWQGDFYASPVVMIVQAISTFPRDRAGKVALAQGWYRGDTACYIGTLPMPWTTPMAWVAEYGRPLTEVEATGFHPLFIAPNGVHVEYRA